MQGELDLLGGEIREPLKPQNLFDWSNSKTALIRRFPPKTKLHSSLTLSEEGKLLFLGYPVEQTNVLEETKRVIEQHIADELDETTCLEKIIFCIGSQNSDFERPSRFIRRCRELYTNPVENLRDIGFLKTIKPSMQYPSEIRVPPMYEYLNKKYEGSALAFAQDFLERPYEVRKEIVKEVKYVASKTASFFYLCFGGKELMTLDVHNFRHLYELGIDIPRRLYEKRVGKNGKSASNHPGSLRAYIRIENKAKEFLEPIFRQYPEFILRNEEIDWAFVTALFWWDGARNVRDIDPRQESFVGFKNKDEIIPF